jgi:16S rRNA (adenine(1408)-N(1))-methyltransferase
LVVGLDANRAGMVDASRRAARLSNALFAVAAAESLPDELRGRADLLTIQFPWGSLLQAVVGGNAAVAAGIARLLAPTGRLRLLVASAPRDGMPAIDPERVAHAVGLEPVLIRPATLDDARTAHSSWGKRLLSRPDPQRQAWFIELAGPDGTATSVHSARTLESDGPRIIGP